MTSGGMTQASQFRLQAHQLPYEHGFLYVLRFGHTELLQPWLENSANYIDRFQD